MDEGIKKIKIDKAVADNLKDLEKVARSVAIVAEGMLPTYEYEAGKSRRDEDYLISLYEAQVWVYAATYAIAADISSLPIKLYNIEGEKTEVTEHTCLDLLNFPNSDRTKEDLIFSTAAYLQLCGLGYWEVVWKTIGKLKVPRELWNIMPSRLTPNPDPGGKGIKNYTFQLKKYAKKTIFRKDQIVPFNEFAPRKDWGGQGSIEPVNEELCLDWNMVQWNKDFFARGAVLDGVLTTEQNLTKASLKDVQKQWAAYIAGLEKTRLLVLSAGLEYKPLQSAPKDLEYEIGREGVCNRVLSAIGVPPVKVGILKDAKYDNYMLQMETYYRDTIRPKCRRMAGALRLHYLPLFDIDPRKHTLEFDLSEVMTEDEDKVIRRHDIQIRNGTMTPNEARDYKGLEPYDDGDTFYVGSNMVPAEEAGQGDRMEEMQDAALGAVNNAASANDSKVAALADKVAKLEADRGDEDSESKIRILERKITKLEAEQDG